MNQKKKLFRDLTTVYQQALHNDNLNTALKAIELKARLEGLYLPQKTKKFSLTTLSNEDLDALLQELNIEENL